MSSSDRRADALVADLRARGCRPGDRVVLLAPTSAGAVEALHALAAIGAVTVPLGHRLTLPELRAVTDLVRPTLVLHDATTASTAEATGVPMHELSTPGGAGGGGVAGGSGAAGGAGIVEPPADPGPGDALVLTSGTTGRPKLARLSGGALARSAAAWSAVLPPATGWLLALGLAHVAGLGVVWRAALARVPVVVADPASDALLGAIRAHPGATHCSLVPTQLARLLDEAEAAGSPRAPASLRALLLGGAPIPPELVVRSLAAGWPVVPTYGLTETASGVTALPSADAAARPSSAGRPLPGVELRIDEPGPDGVGEILVRSSAAFDGYLDDPDATAAAFVPGGWYRTGDVGRLELDGELTVVDRRIDLVISGGENVAPAEVEAALLEHPAVADAGVVGRPDPTWGAVPVAALVLAPGVPDPGDDALRAWCRERLAPYKVPAAFVRVGALPRTASGKLRRAELRASLGVAA